MLMAANVFTFDISFPQLARWTVIGRMKVADLLGFQHALRRDKLPELAGELHS